MMGDNEKNDLRSATMRANIRRGERTRVVIVGCGLGGLKLAMSLRHSGFQVVVVDKDFYDQFPPAPDCGGYDCVAP